MRESKLIGTFLPSSPDLLPTIQQMWKKYGLTELSPDDELIQELFLKGAGVILENFHQEFGALVRGLRAGMGCRITGKRPKNAPMRKQ